MILITGITGHSGKYFYNELVKNNFIEKIRLIVREHSDISFIKDSKLNIEICKGDLDDKNFLNKAMNGVRLVFHIASIFFSKNVIEAMQQAGVMNGIFVHTTGIYSKYKMASFEYKEIESYIDNISRNNDINILYLRPTMIYGYPGDKNMIVFIKMVDKLKLFPVVSGGKNLIQPVNGRDLGKAYYQVLCSGVTNGDYILSGRDIVSMKQLFIMIAEIIGKKIYFISIPLKIAAIGAKILYVLTVKKVDFIEKVLRMGEDRCYSNEETVKIFGYDPMPLRDGLRLEIEDYKTNRNIF